MRILDGRREHKAIIVTGIGSRTDDPSTARLDEFACIGIDGWVVSPTHFGRSHDLEMTNTPLTHCFDLAGEWMAAFRAPDGAIALLADHFGYAQVFYSILAEADGSRTLVASTSFRGALDARRGRGHGTTLREEILLPQLSSHHNFFATRWSPETPAEGIHVLPYDALLVCSKRGLAVVKRPERSATDPDQLFETGIEWSSKVMDRALDSGLPVHLNLSGGKDSRAVLALLLASGRHREVTVQTFSGAGREIGASRDILDRDAVLASTLVARYGMTWLDRSGWVEHVIGRERYLEYWQDYRSASSHEISEHASVISSPPSIELQGMGGELFRSYLGPTYPKNYPAWWKSAGKTDRSVRRDFAALFPVVCQPELLEPDLFARSREAYVEALDFAREGNAIDMIDHSYFQYRNRAHAGTAAFRSAANQWLVYPLSSPDLVRFSSQSAGAVPDEGRTLFEIIERLAPDLNVLDFMAPPWPASYKSRGRPDSWNAVDANDAQERRLQLPSPQRNEIDHDKAFRFDSRLRENAVLVQDAGLSDGLLRRAARLAQRNSRLRNVVLAVSETARDVLLSASGPATQTTLHVSASTHAASTDRIEMSTFAREAVAVDVSSVTAVLAIDASARIVSVQVEGLPEGCEAACYLHLDGHRVDTIWYQPSPQFTFDVSEHTGTNVRVSVFLRWVGTREAQRVFDLAGALV